MTSSLPKLGILVGPKSSGSNMGAIIRACASGEIPAEVQVVVVPNEGAPAGGVARDLGAKVLAVDPDGSSYTQSLLEALDGCSLICLAGYLRLLPNEVLKAFPKRVINIHPALLPEFGGKGMFGKRVHQAVIDAHVKESGCSVHFVTPVYDEGELILQRRVLVLPDDTPETLAQRIRTHEHTAYPEAIRKVLASV